MKCNVFKYLIIVIMSLLTSVGVSYSWLTDTKTVSADVSGSSTSAYYASGVGSVSDPFIINHPRHLYNFAWLQDLGNYNVEGDSKRPYYFALENDIDMSQLGSNFILPPIGTNDNPFDGVFNGNGYSISGLKVSTNKAVLSNPPRAEYAFSKYVGFFGETGNNSSVSNFILDDPIIEASEVGEYSISQTSDYAAGLAVGYVGKDAKSIGIKKGSLYAPKSVKTYNSIIGEYDADVVIPDVPGLSDGNDTGVMYADDIFAQLESGEIPSGSGHNFSSTNNGYQLNANAWVGSDEQSFGIFNLTGYREPVEILTGFTSTSANYYKRDLSGVTSNSSALEETYNQTTPTKTLTFGQQSDTDSAKFVDQSGNIINSVQHQLYFETSIKRDRHTTVTDYDNNSYSAEKYNNALFFDIESENGGEINFVASIPSSKSNGDRLIGLWMFKEGTTTIDGDISGDPNLYQFNIGGASSKENRTAAFSFTLPKGKYMIGSAKNGLYFNYVSVSGQNGNGEVGSQTGSISNVDFIYDNVSISSTNSSFVIVDENGNENSYQSSEVRVYLEYDSSTSISNEKVILYFKRETNSSNQIVFTINYIGTAPLVSNALKVEISETTEQLYFPFSV